jgi:hypothetical protein
VKGVTEILLREAIPLKGSLALWRQNKPPGFACVSCSLPRLALAFAFKQKVPELTISYEDAAEVILDNLSKSRVRPS